MFVFIICYMFVDRKWDIVCMSGHSVKLLFKMICSISWLGRS